jgi:hypothetical protein
LRTVHGVAILRYTKLSDGELLVKGKTVTGFANVEEDFADNAVWSMNLLSRDKHIMPWRVEDELKKLGANYIQSGLWRGFAVCDGNLITGQQKFLGLRNRDGCHRGIGRVKRLCIISLREGSLAGRGQEPRLFPSCY